MTKKPATIFDFITGITHKKKNWSEYTDTEQKKFSSFKKIEVVTENNDFLIKSGKKIEIKGNKFDATNLVKSLQNDKKENKFKEINSKIEIDFKNIKIPLSENLENFKLLGEIKNGQFVKISSKGSFGSENFLDILENRSISLKPFHTIKN